MKNDTKEEINRLEENLENTKRTLEALEMEEKEVKHRLKQLGLEG